jgi:gas vesicle structural protein
MPVERASGGTSLIDVLDRVLDKGIVIDAWVRVSLVGIDLLTVEARVVVASIDTYIKYSEAVSQVPSVSRPTIEARSSEDLRAENASLRAQLAASNAREEAAAVAVVAPRRSRPAVKPAKPAKL